MKLNEADIQWIHYWNLVIRNWKYWPFICVSKFIIKCAGVICLLRNHTMWNLGQVNTALGSDPPNVFGGFGSLKLKEAYHIKIYV